MIVPELEARLAELADMTTGKERTLAPIDQTSEDLTRRLLDRLPESVQRDAWATLCGGVTGSWYQLEWERPGLYIEVEVRDNRYRTYMKRAGYQSSRRENRLHVGVVAGVITRRWGIDSGTEV